MRVQSSDLSFFSFSILAALIGAIVNEDWEIEDLGVAA